MRMSGAAAGSLVLWAALLCAARPHGHADPSASRALTMADDAYQREKWAVAAQLYRRVNREHSAPSRRDEILFRIGYCSEESIRELVALVDPARFNPAHHDDTEKLRPFLHWLRVERGYYPQFSEGDSVWRYDGGAYRELLDAHPDSAYADDAAVRLVRIDFLMRHNPAILFARDGEARSAAQSIVAAYESVLSRYPDGGSRRECEEQISVWNAYLAGSDPPWDWLWIQD